MKEIEEVWSQDTKKIVATLISILMMGGEREIAVIGNTQEVQIICPEEGSQRVTHHLIEHQERLMIGKKFKTSEYC